MNCEVVAVGTELLLGQIVDTNSSWIGEQLAAAGINSHYQTKVGDNWDRITDVLNRAISRSDAVVVTGGLGPTQDDITREVVADLMGVELVLDEAIAQRIREMFESRGRPMPQNNLRQAMVPQGAKPIPEQPGTAPGLIIELPRPTTGSAQPAADSPVVLYLVPGVPREMKAMLNGTVLADLRSRAGHTDVIASRVLRTWGESESGLAERLAERITELDEVGNPTLAFLASGIEGIKVRITARASNQAAADELLDTEAEALRTLLGSLVFSSDDESMEQVVLKRLAERNHTLAIAETFTGGLMANRLSAAQQAFGAAATGTSVVPFRAGTVEHGAREHGTSEHSASASARGDAGEMAMSVKQMFGTDWGLAVCEADSSDTEVVIGIAGDLAAGDPTTSGPVTRTLIMPTDLQQRSQWSTISAFDWLRQALES